jgi:PAS domain S-box-containing protein
VPERKPLINAEHELMAYRGGFMSPASHRPNFRKQLATVPLEHELEPHSVTRSHFDPALDGSAPVVPHGMGSASDVEQQDEDLVSALLENAPFGIYIVDHQLRLRAVNKGAESAFRGIEPLVERDFAEILRIIWPAPVAREILARFRHTLATGDDYVAPTLTKDRYDLEQTESYDWRLHRLTLPDGNFGVVCYFYDVTPWQRVDAVGAFHTLLERAPFGVYVIDADFRVLEVNPNARDRLGDASNLLGRPFDSVLYERWPREYADELVGRFRHTLETGESYATTERAESRSKPGNVESHDWRIDRIPLPDGRRGVVCYFQDTSALEGAREAAALADALARRVAAANSLRVELADALRLTGEPLQMQTAALRVLGRHLGASRAVHLELAPDGEMASVISEYRLPEVASMLGEWRSAMFGPALASKYRFGWTVAIGDVQAVAGLTESERAAYAAIDVAAYAGVPLIEHGRLVGVMSLHCNRPREWSADDLTLLEEAVERIWAAVQHARADASLRDTEARLQRALEAASMGTFQWNISEDRGEPDARMLALFGLSSADQLNLAAALASMIHPDDRARYAAAVGAATQPDGTGQLREDIRVVHGDGSVHWLAITAQTTFEGQPRRAARMAGIATDVSERKFIEAALRESEERLQHADRRKDEFIAVLAHELRNPLAPIRTGLEVIALSGNTPDSVSRVRSMMQRQLSHMVRLVDDLLDVARITSGQFRLQRQPTALTTLVNTALDAHRAALEKQGIGLVVDVPELPLELDVDPARFVQIISNLMHNAIKFSRVGDKIRLSAFVNAQGSNAAPELTLSVVDSGGGIARELLPRVFELFVQGSVAGTAASGGLGIGLALARRLIEMHGGSIDAASDGPGKGSAFTIRLPASLVVAAPVVSAPAIQARELRHRVVVIDDNRDAADTMALLVAAAGGECRVAYDGEDGLRQVLEYRPDVVLLDIGLPGIDGYETCRCIRRALGSAVVVVALTGWGQDRDKAEASKAGFDSHLTKPVDAAALVRRLASADPLWA